MCLLLYLIENRRRVGARIDLPSSWQVQPGYGAVMPLALQRFRASTLTTESLLAWTYIKAINTNKEPTTGRVLGG